jgi:hypothetical protein
MLGIKQTVVIETKVMLAGDANFLDIILFIAAGGAMAVVVLAVLFGVIQTWRHRAAIVELENICAIRAWPNPRRNASRAPHEFAAGRGTGGRGGMASPTSDGRESSHLELRHVRECQNVTTARFHRSLECPNCRALPRIPLPSARHRRPSPWPPLRLGRRFSRRCFTD